MFIISAPDPLNGGVRYWIGGRAWSPHPDQAVRFVQEVDAESTVPLIEVIDGMTSGRLMAVPVLWPVEASDT